MGKRAKLTNGSIVGAPLQSGNQSSLREIPLITVGKIRNSKFGVCASAPHTIDENEIIWDSNHLNDGDYGKCWSDQGHVNTNSGTEWVLIIMDKIREVSRVRLVACKGASGFPVDFEIQCSDGSNWMTVVRKVDYAFSSAETVHDFKFPEQKCRFVRLCVTKFSKIEPLYVWFPNVYAVRLAELEVYDNSGRNYALSQNGGRVVTSSTGYGYNSDPRRIMKIWPSIYDLGVKWIRIGQWGDATEWSLVEKEKGKYEIDPLLDEAITEATRRNVNFHVTLCYGNDLYQTRERSNVPVTPAHLHGHPFYGAAPTTPEAIKAFGNYCHFMVSHFKGRIKYWEVYNEENICFWQPQADPDQYSALLKEASKRIKEADPKSKVMFGGLSEAAQVIDDKYVCVGQLFDLAFLKECLDRGVGSFIDAVAFHPYQPSKIPEEASVLDLKGSNTPRYELYEREFKSLRELVFQYNRNVEFFCNEVGWFAYCDPPKPGGTDTWLYQVSELTQAKYLARQYILNLSLGVYTLWWHLYNDSHFEQYGLLRPKTMTPRPAYNTLRILCHLFGSAQPISMRLSFNNVLPELKSYVFKRNDGKLLIALWLAVESTDFFEGVPLTLEIPKTSRRSKMIIVDTLNSYAQDLVAERKGSTTIVRDLMIRDYPLILII